MTLPKKHDARKALPLYDFFTRYFPDALVELVKVSVVGNAQHNPGEPMHWARGKSMDQLNTAQRHIMDHGAGHVFDESDDERVPGMRTRHLAKAAWRLLAEIQLACERDAAPTEAEGQPVSPPTEPRKLWVQTGRRDPPLAKVRRER